MTQEQADGFLKKLQEDGKSPRDIAGYARCISQLCEIAEKTGGELTEAVLVEWKNVQMQQNLAPGTVTNRVVKINHFLRYLGLEQFCFPNGGRQKLAGRRFGNLVAIAPLEERTADRSVLWKCRCLTCGKEKAIPANQLRKGVQISCGCNRENRLQQTNGYIAGTCLKNVFSDKISSNNTSGCKGVFRKRGKWAASIQYQKKNYYLGSYDRLEDAVAARKQAENQVRDHAAHLLEQFRGNEET